LRDEFYMKPGSGMSRRECRALRPYSMTMRGGVRRSAPAPATFSQIRAPIRRKTSAYGLSGSETVIGAAVGGFADFEVERHLAEKLGAQALGFLAGAAMRKDLAAAAVIPSVRGIEGL
jgi:hypothetical protein